MSITWDIQITNVQIASKRADVTATRADSAVTDPPQVYNFPNTPIGTAAERATLLNSIKAEVVKRLAADNAAATTVTDLEQAGKSALEAWELTR